MTISARIKEAEILYSLGRTEGAWVQALIATAATSRMRYPRGTMSDSKAFKSFVCDIANIIVTGNIKSEGPIYIKFYGKKRGDGWDLEEILYNELRCNLLHEATLNEIGFSETEKVDGRPMVGLHVGAKGSDGEIPGHWVLNLIAAIKAAPENQFLDWEK